MSQAPVITYSNLKHKIADTVTNGIFSYTEETININCTDGSKSNTLYKLSYNAPYNSITGNYSSSIILRRFEIRVNPIEEEDFGPNVGTLVFYNSGNITANQSHAFTITVTQEAFTGSPSDTYRICLLAQSSLDHTWDFKQLFMTINDSFTSQYDEVAYLESTGTQYINTGISYASNLDYKIKFSITNLTKPTSNYSGIMGKNNTLQIAWDDTGKFITGNDTWNNNTTAVINTIYTAIANTTTGDFYINGIKAATRGSVTGSGAVGIFGYDGYRCNARVYSATIKSNNILVRDFIPAVRKSDSKPGLYDKVNKIFYVNQASGTDFTAGSTIANSINRYERFDPTSATGYLVGATEDTIE